MAHGPRNERDYAQKVNKKMRTKALYAVLSKKLAHGEVLFLDAFSFPAPKTKDAKQAIIDLAKIDGYAALATKRRNAALFALPEKDDAVMKSLRNFGNLSLDEVRNLNPVDVMKCKYLVLVGGDAAVSTLATRGAKKTN